MLRYDVVDVFTSRAFAGNPLAVVHGGEGLDDAGMQAVAREFNLSETAFPLPPTDPAADYRLRIFTPLVELPFAGLPGIGAAWVLASQGLLRHGPVVQQTGAGLHEVVVTPRGATLAGGEPGIGRSLDSAPLAAALGLSPSDVDEGIAAGAASAGMEFTFLPVRQAAVARARPAPDLADRVVGRGLVPVAFDPVGRVARVRMFRATGGEDPATGSAALALAAWLVDRGLLPGDGEHEFTVRQGAEIDRPSTLDCWVAAVGGRATRVRCGGGVVPVAQGRIRRPGR
ncbi:PhzF family phenazine biosynthesis protein [Saccharothrix coeruleofusca]|uniref:Phenazine biosynthesis-like protein n=1 Tax=Saccharothrix coeruleofusca TaxID=33919 RepID=A0A918EDV6_9PSEU|nr:PhzF family phenazine biosynthesis protein [Saccharothrix coeruleofusca]GGP60858.1 phenazine biosynthesis-like protein [Saccharothrix coeruleofusca]